MWVIMESASDDPGCVFLSQNSYTGSEGLKTLAGANILSLTLLGFNNDVPLFLNPLRIFIGVMDWAHISPTSDAITSESFFAGF